MIDIKEVDTMTKTVLFSHKKFIKEMKASNLSQEQLAEHLGISDRHIRNLKRKDIPISAPRRYRISQEFGQSMEYFLTSGEEGDDIL